MTSKPDENRSPPLAQQAWSVAGALAAFIADSLKTVSKELYQQRLEVCEPCEQRRGDRCLKCGCFLSLKARGRAFACPLDKWPLPSTDETDASQS